MQSFEAHTLPGRAKSIRSFKYFSIIFSSLLVLCGSSSVYSQEETKPIAASVIDNLEHDKFEAISSLKQFPQGVKDFYSKWKGKNIQDIFAEPGKPWQSTCVRTEAGAPSQSFVIGAKSNNLCVVYYEAGGYALVDTADLFAIKSGKAEKIWSASMFRKHPKDMNELLSTVRERIKSK